MFGAQRDNVVCCKPAPFAIEASTGCTSGSLLAARHSGRFRRAVRSIARIHHEFIYFSSIYLFSSILSIFRRTLPNRAANESVAEQF